MKLLALAVLAAAAAFSAGDAAGVKIWKSPELKGMEKKMGGDLKTEQFGATGKNSFMIAHREVNGEAELHEVTSDVFLVQSGEATLVYGGSVEGGKTTAAHEIRGASIKGGSNRKLGAGDIVFIPANVPHQLMVEKGKQFTYFVVKTNQ